MFKRLNKLHADQPTISQLLIGLTLAALTGLFFLTSYTYEQAYLTALGVPDEISKSLGQVDLYTYQGMFTGFILLSGIIAPFVILMLRSKRIVVLIKSRFFILVLALTLIALLLIKLYILKLIPSSFNELKTVLELIITSATVPLLLVSAYANSNLKDIKSISLESLSDKILFVAICAGAMYWIIIQGLFAATINIAQIQASFRRAGTEVIVNDQHYQLIRSYGSRIVIKDQKKNRYYSVGADNEKPIEYVQKNLF